MGLPPLPSGPPYALPLGLILDDSGRIYPLVGDEWGHAFAGEGMPEAILRGRVPGFTGAMSGRVATMSVAETAVRSGVFVSQTLGRRRSIASDNVADDNGGGAGARSVRITYFTMTAGVVAGPLTEDINLNGVAPKNTVATDICHIERLEVLTSGSGNANVGTVTLFAQNGGNGGAIAQILPGELRTNYSQHFVASGRSAYLVTFIVGVEGALSLTRVNMKYLDYSVTNACERFVFDNVIAEAGRGTLQLGFRVARKIVGPARLLAYAVPGDALPQVQHFGCSFYEI